MRRSPVRPEAINHGTRTGYKYGCKCEKCKAANSAYMRSYNALIRRGVTK